MEFVIIFIGIFFLSVAGFVQMYVYAQIKLKTVVLLVVIVNFIFVIIMMFNITELSAKMEHLIAIMRNNVRYNNYGTN